MIHLRRLVKMRYLEHPCWPSSVFSFICRSTVKCCVVKAVFQILNIPIDEDSYYEYHYAVTLLRETTDARFCSQLEQNIEQGGPLPTGKFSR